MCDTSGLKPAIEVKSVLHVRGRGEQVNRKRVKAMFARLPEQEMETSCRSVKHQKWCRAGEAKP